MTKPLTLQEKRDLAEHNSWRDWGNRFGFRLYGSNGKYAATFKLVDGSDFHVPLVARQAIEIAMLSHGESTKSS